MVMTSIPTSSCHNAEGDPDEDKCEASCINELNKYKKYHQIIVDAQQKEIQHQQKKMQKLYKKHRDAQAAQLEQAKNVKDLKGTLANAETHLSKKEQLVKVTQTEVEQGEAE